MNRRRVGTTDAQVTSLGLGGAALGNLFEAISDDVASATIGTAWEDGVRYFDTAPHYGLGLSEQRLGAYLADRPRGEYVISTKFGRLLVPNPRPTGMDPEFVVPDTMLRRWDFSADGVKRSLEQSLDRLGLDRVDIVFIHDPDDHWDDAVNAAFPALAELRDQGVVSAIGVGMNQGAMAADFVWNTDLDVVMLAGRYTLLDQSALGDVLPACIEHDVAVINVGVFNSGVLSSPDPGDDSRYDYGPASTTLIERARRIADVCRRHGTTLPCAAVQFGFSHPSVVSVAVGAGAPAQMTASAEFLNAEIPDDLWRELSAEGLIDTISRPEGKPT